MMYLWGMVDCDNTRKPPFSFLKKKKKKKKKKIKNHIANVQYIQKVLATIDDDYWF